MPRANRYQSKAGPAIAPGPQDEAPDTGAAAQQRVLRTTAAAGAKDLPPVANSSPFALGQALRKPRGNTGGQTKFDPATVALHNRPLPPPSTGKGAVGAYEALFNRMQVGQSVDLPKTSGLGFATWAKKAGHKVATRYVAPGVLGCWLLAKAGAAGTSTPSNAGACANKAAGEAGHGVAP